MVNLKAVIGNKNISFEELKSLNEGDIISLNNEILPYYKLNDFKQDNFSMKDVIVFNDKIGILNVVRKEETLNEELNTKEHEKIEKEISKKEEKEVNKDFVKEIPEKFLRDYIKDESPHTIAIILSNIDSFYASKILLQLEEDIKVKVTIQMATMRGIDKQIVNLIFQSLKDDIKNFKSFTEINGVNKTAEILNIMGEKSKDILKNINSIDSSLRTKLKERME